MHLALEELQPNDSIDDDHKKDKQGDVEQGEHGLEDGVEDYLKACHRKQGEEKKRVALPQSLVTIPLQTVGYPGQKGQKRAWEKRCCHPLGTPDTSRRGLSTRKALRAFTSKPAPLLLKGAVLV